tara:strand:- start:88211 stop:90298 length:2088 start_codon:yes stop_codon:yes gene_type:complete
MRRLFSLLSTVGLFLASPIVHSQGKDPDSTLTTQLKEVVLTATRTERQLSSLPLPVTLITKQTINQSGTVRLNEILQEQTGIVTVADESGFEGVQIQGISSEYILILIDGVPLVGRSAGNFDLSRLTVGNIKQIEVVKGPSSSLYGSEALGGVINIITEKPDTESLSGNASYRIGSNTTQDINLDLQQHYGPLRYGFFVNRFSSEGYDLRPDTEGQTVPPFHNYTFNGRTYLDLNDKLALFSSGRFFDQKQDAGITVDNISYEGDSKEREWNAHLRLDHKWNPKLETQYELYFTNYTATELLAEPLNGEVLSDSDFDQTLLRPEIRSTYTFTDNSKLTGGAGYQFDRLDRTYFDGEAAFESQYLYLQYDVNPLAPLNVILGGRFDNHSEYNDQFSPKLAIRYQLNEQLSLRSSVGYGFKAPDFRQLYFDFSNSALGYTVLGYNVAVAKLMELEALGQISNILVPYSELGDPLKAERSIGYNLGVVYKLDKLSVDINLFRNDFENMIDTRAIARKTNGQNVFSYSNFHEIFTTGGEVNATYSLTDDLNLSAGYQLLYAYDKEKKESVKNGEVFARDPLTNQTLAIKGSDHFGLINRSRHNANLKLFYNLPKAAANMNVRVLYRSKYAQYDTNGNGLIDSYDSSFIKGNLLINVAATKNIYKKFDIQLGANNLFDSTDENIPGQPGMQLFAKLNYQF